LRLEVLLSKLGLLPWRTHMMNPPGDSGEVGLMPKPLLINTAKAHCPGCPGEAELRSAPLHVDTSAANHPGCPGVVSPRQEPLLT